MFRLILLVYGSSPKIPVIVFLIHILIHLCNRDTVDSVGIIPKRLPFTTSNTIVRTFRHAVALDERRAKFKANLWNRPNDQEVKLGLHAKGHPLVREQSFDEPPHEDNRDRKNGYETRRTKSTGEFIFGSSNKQKKKMVLKEDERDKELNVLERIYSEMSDKVTDIEEVWFAVRYSMFSSTKSH